MIQPVFTVHGKEDSHTKPWGMAQPESQRSGDDWATFLLLSGLTVAIIALMMRINDLHERLVKVEKMMAASAEIHPGVADVLLRSP